MGNFWKRAAQAVATPIKIVGNAAKKAGNYEGTRYVFGDSVGSAIARTGEGMETTAKEKPGLALAAMATGGSGMGIMAGLGAIEGYKKSQEAQAEVASGNAAANATQEFNNLQAAETDKQLQARLKARQEEIMLRSGQTQKNIFGTGKNQPSGILG